MRKWVALSLLPVAACSTMAAEEPEPRVEGQTPGFVCKAEGLGSFVGREGTAEVGAEILRQSGAKTMRWLRPGMMVTMEFREDRVNVHLDANGRIERVNCG